MNLFLILNTTRWLPACEIVLALLRPIFSVSAASAPGLFFTSSVEATQPDGQVLRYHAASAGFLGIAGGPFPDDRIQGITVGPDGLLHVSAVNAQGGGTTNPRIVRYDLKGNFVNVFVGEGLAEDAKLGNPDGLGNPGNLRFGPDGKCGYFTTFPC